MVSATIACGRTGNKHFARGYCKWSDADNQNKSGIGSDLPLSLGKRGEVPKKALDTRTFAQNQVPYISISRNITYPCLHLLQWLENLTNFTGRTMPPYYFSTDFTAPCNLSTGHFENKIQGEVVGM
jgi:hypothetical protein